MGKVVILLRGIFDFGGFMKIFGKSLATFFFFLFSYWKWSGYISVICETWFMVFFLSFPKNSGKYFLKKRGNDAILFGNFLKKKEVRPFCSVNFSQGAKIEALTLIQTLSTYLLHKYASFQGKHTPILKLAMKEVT